MSFRSVALVICTLAVSLASSAALADGTTVYKDRCASCHGADGKAQTAIAKMMPVANLTEAKVQAMSAQEIAKKTKEAAKHPAAVKALSDADATAAGEFVKTLGQ
jgi:cytochrome c553